jgi:hypothetical protein
MDTEGSTGDGYPKIEVPGPSGWRIYDGLYVIFVRRLDRCGTDLKDFVNLKGVSK